MADSVNANGYPRSTPREARETAALQAEAGSATGYDTAHASGSPLEPDVWLQANAADLQSELGWFAEVLEARLRSYFHPGERATAAPRIPPPPLGASRYAEFVRRHALTPDERLVLVLALVPHIRPQLLDVLWSRNEATDRGFAEFGGWQSVAHGGFLPTAETALFLLAGGDLEARFHAMRIFDGEHVFAREGVLHLASGSPAEPHVSGALTLSPEHLHLFTTGEERKPGFSSDFPARRVETQLEWEDLVLPAVTREQLEEIRDWITHGGTLLDDWGMRRKLQPGFTSLFHGPPGTGKTLAACLLGKYCGCDVYKVDLSTIVSKYIGETEKNLAKIFAAAENKRWILFFDEADALFGKRTRIESSHDRFANQEVSFLLQRIEDFGGVVILASNLKTNIDEAFIRRFQSIVYFPMPRPAERRRLWQGAFSPRASLEERIDLALLAEKHELSGGTIMNVVRFSSIRALSRNGSTIRLEDMEEGIRREYLKEGRTV